MTVGITAIHPVLVMPGGTALDADADTVRGVIQRLQAWFEGVGLPVLLLDPKAATRAPELDWFAAAPGGIFYGAQAWAVEHGYTQRGCKALVILAGYPDGHGESGPSVAVVGYRAVADLASGDAERVNTACGLIAHEIGHLLSFGHTPEPGDLMSEMGHFISWPYVSLVGEVA